MKTKEKEYCGFATIQGLQYEIFFKKDEKMKGRNICW
jgi:hypothetical protein